METCLASWYISERCNFRCEYCYIYNPPGMKGVLRRAKKLLKPGLPRTPDISEHLDDILSRFLATGMRFTFAFTGGEPFVYPRFVEICRRIAAHDEFTIGLDTNLSMGVERLMEAVPPEKAAFVFASTHALERERRIGSIDSFLDDVATLIERGYSVETNYVMHPALLGRFETDRRRAAERGVTLTPKHFKGLYEGRLYPDAYTDEERRFIRELNPKTGGCTVASRNFLGLPCRAGHDLIRIMGNGGIYRCPGDYLRLGNIFTGFRLLEGPAPCTSRYCPCYTESRLIPPGAERVPVSRISYYRNRLRHISFKALAWWQQG